MLALSIITVQTAYCISAGNIEVWVYDSANDTPIPFVRVELDYAYGTGYNYAFETDANGYAKQYVIAASYYVNLGKEGYIAKTGLGPYQVYEKKTTSYTFKLDKKTTPPPGTPPSEVTVTFYLVDPDKYRVTQGHCTFKGSEHSVDGDGKIVVFNVQPGEQSFTFSGGYAAGGQIGWANFHFTSTIIIPEQDCTYTVWVATSQVVAGIPPAPPIVPKPIIPLPSPESILSWLLNPSTWFWLAIGFIGLIVLLAIFAPGLLGVVIGRIFSKRKRRK